MGAKTILFDLTSLYDHVTGIERYAMEIAWHMIKVRPDNRYILVFKNEIHTRFKEFENDRNVRFVVAKGKNKLVFNQLVLPKILKKHRADAYLFLAFPCPLLFSRKNIYVAIHDMSPWECNEGMKWSSRVYYKLSHRHAFKKARKIITISKYSMDRILALSKIKQSDIWLIYCGITKFDNSSNNKERILPEKYILSLSTLEPRKNLRLLIDAYCEIAAEQNDIPKLVLVGRSGWKLEEALGDSYKANMDNIIFTEYLEESEMASVYRNASFFVFPSKYEGFGMPPLEAMSQGVPVLSSDATSMPEILKGAARYFESDNKQDLIKKLKDMLMLSIDNSQQMIAEGLSIAEEYSWEEEAKKLAKKIETTDVRIRL